MVSNSTGGKYVETRLRELGAQVNAELSGEKSAIDTEARTLQSQRATMDQNALRQRASALQERENTLEQKAAIRSVVCAMATPSATTPMRIRCPIASTRSAPAKSWMRSASG